MDCSPESFSEEKKCGVNLSFLSSAPNVGTDKPCRSWGLIFLEGTSSLSTQTFSLLGCLYGNAMLPKQPRVGTCQSNRRVWQLGCGGGNWEAEVDMWLCCISFVCEQRAHGCCGAGKCLENLWSLYKRGSWAGAQHSALPSRALPTTRDPSPSGCVSCSQDPCFWLES